MTAHLHLWRRIRILPGITANTGKRGVSSVSLGRRGLHVTVGRERVSTTIGLPGTGIFVTDVEPRRPGNVDRRGYLADRSDRAGDSDRAGTGGKVNGPHYRPPFR
jgi:Protein of unknown function (DUF4236)